MARVALLALSAALLAVATQAHREHKTFLHGVPNPLSAPHGAHLLAHNNAPHRPARDLHLPAPGFHGPQPTQKGAVPHGLPLAAHGVAPQIAHNGVRGIAGALSHHQGHNQHAHLLGQRQGQHQKQHQGLPHGQHQGLPQGLPHGQHQPLGQHQGLVHNVPQHTQHQGHQLLGHQLGVPHRAARGLHGPSAHGQQGRPQEHNQQGVAPHGVPHSGHGAAPQIAGRLLGEHLLGHAKKEHQVGKLLGQIHIGQHLLKKSPLGHLHGAIHLQHHVPALLGRAPRAAPETPVANADEHGSSEHKEHKKPKEHQKPKEHKKRKAHRKH